MPADMCRVVLAATGSCVQTLSADKGYQMMKRSIPGELRSIVMSMSVCLSVCLSLRMFARVSQKSHCPTSPNFLCMLIVAVARSSSGGVAIRYVLPVLWTTSPIRTRLCIPKQREDNVLA